ncbi:IMPACT family protein [Simiduia sp. 21SJ11W-1]|uniref:IMPACT family protein n=1 Tax=Simiduia sp. 21SJ11W-1 TaxID=2909669 RepID=UPI00209CDDDC|nr:YigZ family protein [Simiduia sp. 21SJ11W-1]UTA46964.1 IMPACT family protein [Simiduia sp. 21SJ11W-1]
MTGAYTVASGQVQVEYEIKKSRFIARAAVAASREQALAQLGEAKHDYPDARHHCWAYVIGDPYSPSLAACADDGEPSGTAGKPILNVLGHKQVGDVMLIVIRYFGGIKLGAGGLVRAYSQAAQLAMAQLPLAEVTPKTQLHIVGGYALEQALRHFLSLHHGEVLTVEYGAHCLFTVVLPEAQLALLREWLGAQDGHIQPPPLNG